MKSRLGVYPSLRQPSTRSFSLRASRELVGRLTSIGNSRFALFTKGDKAFVSDATQELKLIDSMKRGSFMTVRAVTNDGTSISDTYSLIGVTAAVNALAGGCG